MREDELREKMQHWREVKNDVDSAIGMIDNLLTDRRRARAALQAVLDARLLMPIGLIKQVREALGLPFDDRTIWGMGPDEI